MSASLPLESQGRNLAYWQTVESSVLNAHHYYPHSQTAGSIVFHVPVRGMWILVRELRNAGAVVDGVLRGEDGPTFRKYRFRTASEKPQDFKSGGFCTTRTARSIAGPTIRPFGSLCYITIDLIATRHRVPAAMRVTTRAGHSIVVGSPALHA
jgi:hypothetical protein